MFFSISFQTLSKSGESSLSSPQQYVAVQRPALPLQKGRCVCGELCSAAFVGSESCCTTFVLLKIFSFNLS